MNRSVSRSSRSSVLPVGRRRRLVTAIAVAGIVTSIAFRRSDIDGLRRDVIRNTVGIAPKQFYQALALDQVASANEGFLTIAHNAGDRRETTEAALNYGADVIEVDVVAIGDRLYAAHDQPNARVGAVTFRGPTLASIWSVSAETSRIELDLKESTPEYLNLVVAFVNARDAGADIIIASKSATALETLRAELPDATLIYSVGDLATYDALKVNETLLDQIDGVSVRAVLLDDETISWLKDRNLLVLAWTVNDFARAENLIELGIDGIATDNLAIIEHYDERTEIER